MYTVIIEDKDGGQATRTTCEEGQALIVGRSNQCDIILPSDNVSRRHARLYVQDGRCYAEDLGSSNGVYVNGKRIHRVTELGRSAHVRCVPTPAMARVSPRTSSVARKFAEAMRKAAISIFE